MGIGGSKDGTMRRVNSSSAAFGRLRIDSPGSARHQLSIRRRQQLRLVSEQGSSGGVSPMIGSGYSTEHSPLLATPKHQQQLHPHLQTIQSEIELEPSSMTTIPPLAVWIAPALCCAMAYALYNIFIKKGSSHINPVLGGVILQLVAAILGCCLLMFLVIKEGGAEVITFDREGVQWAILAGLSVGAAEIISFFVSSLGVQAMQSIPIIIGGSVMFGTVLGAVALHEELSHRGWLGVVMISVGISLVGLDSQGDGE